MAHRIVLWNAEGRETRSPLDGRTGGKTSGHQFLPKKFLARALYRWIYIYHGQRPSSGPKTGGYETKQNEEDTHRNELWNTNTS